MTKKELKAAQTLLNAMSSMQDQLHEMLGSEGNSGGMSSATNTNLLNRHYDVFICRTYLYMNYEKIANALGISKAQVGESMKFLRDKGLVQSRVKKATLIDDCLDDVKKMKKKKYTCAQMARELGVSPQTVTRCLERLV